MRVKQDLAEEGKSNLKKLDKKSVTNRARDAVKEGDNQ
jgi:hypothetical protein